MAVSTVGIIVITFGIVSPYCVEVNMKINVNSMYISPHTGPLCINGTHAWLILCRFFPAIPQTNSYICSML